MRIDIMGSAWEIVEQTELEDPRLAGNDGLCDWTTRRIVIRKDMDGDLANMERHTRKVKRHEIIHAFLLECGLDGNSNAADAWARNEEMVDWFAHLGPKINKVWREAGAAE